MKSLSKVLMVLALGAVICLPGMASATTVQLAYVGVSSSTITDITETLQPPYSGGVYTGNYDLQIGNIFSPIISGYCVSPVSSNSLFNPYTLDPIVPGTELGNAYEAAAWILSQGYSGTQTQEGQVAVWELAWDYGHGNGFSLTTGNFILNNPGPTSTFATGVEAIYDAALTACGLPPTPQAGVFATTFDYSKYVIADGGTLWQSYVIPDPVPLPPTALLLGTGLFGLVLLGFPRKRRDSQL
jgi:hypothetical protein